MRTVKEVDVEGIVNAVIVGAVVSAQVLDTVQSALIAAVTIVFPLDQEPPQPLIPVVL